MTTATLEIVPPKVTDDQLELVKKTVAQGATPDELKLYLYDCARQGVHPLDKLIHFTKRSWKYTPITSIDFMRIRAAETGEYAGSDDAVFESEVGAEPIMERPLISATVTVWRLVQGQRCAFTATARWKEYKPDANDFMWRKMPHTMLAKCAEALALRKGFPKQLAGLYAKEEMDQAQPPRAIVIETQPAPEQLAHLEEGTVLIVRSEQHKTSKGRAYWRLTLHTGEEVIAWEAQLGALAEQRAQDRVPVAPIYKGEWDGKKVVKSLNDPQPSISAMLEKSIEERSRSSVKELSADDIPF